MEITVYSFFIFYECGSEKDEIGQSGSMHVLEHFVILTLIEKFFNREKNNMSGETGFSYTLISWSHLSYQKGLNIIRGFETCVQDVLSHQEKYYDMMSTAIREVREEILSIPDAHLSINKMMQILSHGKCRWIPMGLKCDLDRMDVGRAFDVLRKQYGKRKPSYFIFDHEKNCFSFIEHNCRNYQKDEGMMTECNTKSAYIKLKQFNLFDHKLIKIGLPRRVRKKHLICGATFDLLDDIYLMSVCLFMEKLYHAPNACQFETVYFDYNNRYDIFELDHCFAPNLSAFATNRCLLLSKKRLKMMLFDTVSFEAIKTDLENRITELYGQRTKRSDCRYEIFNIVWFEEYCRDSISDPIQFHKLLNKITIEDLEVFITLEIEQIDEIMIFS